MSVLPQETTVSANSSTAAAEARAAKLMKRRSRIRFYEIIVWIAAIAAYFLLPSKMLILTEIAILALFAVSLDLVLGFAGIVSLGHTAFFGLGAYVAGLMAQHYFAEPVTGLIVAGIASGVLGLLTSFLILRGSDLTRLMTTLGIGLMMAEVANQMAWLTGGADGLSAVFRLARSSACSSSTCSARSVISIASASSSSAR
jgi:branched-chain amino acid transport system permease protein